MQNFATYQPWEDTGHLKVNQNFLDIELVIDPDHFLDMKRIQLFTVPVYGHSIVDPILLFFTLMRIQIPRY